MEYYTKIRDIAESLQLPALKNDLDSIPLERENFESYHKHLRTNLPLLFDLIQQEPKDIQCNSDGILKSKQEVG